jgi:2-dehydro-3-deoxy-D-gluconate 5-dehydrogenase
VTGASRGVGKAVAEHLASQGADIGMIQRGSASETVAAVEALGRRTVVVRSDLSDPVSAERAVAAVAAELGHLDICVCNAGVIHREPALDVSLEDFARVVSLNLLSTFAVARAAARIFLEQDRAAGAIVLVASVLAFQGGLGVSGYAASKAGVANLARSLSNEWSGLGIRVNAVAPGYLDNQQTEPLRSNPGRKAEIDQRIPAGRWGTNEDVARVVAFLAGPDAAYVDGTVVAVDGGFLGR